MPIKPEFRHFYGKIWKTVTRPRILQRAANCCERCGVPNGVTLLRWKVWWTPYVDRWDEMKSLPVEWCCRAGVTQFMRARTDEIRKVRIVLTIAHLNHRAGDLRACRDGRSTVPVSRGRD